MNDIKQDDKDRSKAWTQVANLSKQNTQDTYIAWIIAAEKAVKHNNPVYKDGNVQYPTNDDIKTSA